MQLGIGRLADDVAGKSKESGKMQGESQTTPTTKPIRERNVKKSMDLLEERRGGQCLNY